MTAKKKGQKVTKRQIWLAVSAVAIGLVAVAICWAFRWAPKKQEIVYPLDYEQELLSAADEFSIDPCLLAALVYCESSFRPDAVSSVGAVGLMQIMPSTAEWIAQKLGEAYDEQLLYDPAVNIRYGCWYLNYLEQRFDGDLTKVTAAYHAGGGQVDQWLEDPAVSSDGSTLENIPSQVTAAYVEKVAQVLEHYKEIMDS